ncbi:MAG: 1,4-alpha-glucan branching enzyme, partial [Acidimicrobiales bacterium]|nr:1,4-alpha-glucan branching enzyme [Acidimicrobiales bacterium]
MGLGRSFTAQDAWLFAEGRHTRLDEVLGAHPGPDGTVFRVWAPNAASVSVICDANGWQPDRHPLDPDPSGVWRGVVPSAGPGTRYKYAVRTRSGELLEKADPVAFRSEEPPATASVVVAGLDHDWGDHEWMAGRAQVQAPDRPMSVYEVHLGSWRYEPGGYRAIAAQLADHVVEL